MWWYLIHGKKIGPVSDEELKKLIASREVGPEALVWKDGDPEWRKLRDCDFDIPAEPPPTPAHLEYPDLAGPWRRFFARTLDVVVESTIALLILLILSILTSIKIDFQDHSALIIVIMLIPFVAFFIDGIIIAIFGNSLGKAILMCNVFRTNGKAMTASELQDRNMEVYASGYALGIPVVSLLAFSYQFYKLKQIGQTSYDLGKFVVKSKQLNWIRVVLFALIFIATSWCAGFMSSVAISHVITNTETKLKNQTNSNVLNGLSSNSSVLTPNNLSDLPNGATGTNQTAVPPIAFTSLWNYIRYYSALNVSAAQLNNAQSSPYANAVNAMAKYVASLNSNDNFLRSGISKSNVFDAYNHYCTRNACRDEFQTYATLSKRLPQWRDKNKSAASELIRNLRMDTLPSGYDLTSLELVLNDPRLDQFSSYTVICLEGVQGELTNLYPDLGNGSGNIFVHLGLSAINDGYSCKKNLSILNSILFTYSP